MKMKSKRGFTLLELIVVMVIITIIAAQVIASFKGASDNGRVASALNSIKAIQTAAMGYFNGNGGSCTGISMATLVSGKYLPASFSGTGANPWGGNYALNNIIQKTAEGVAYNATSSTWTGTF